MSEDNSELLTGRAGNEAAQGYDRMQMAVPDPDPEPAIDADSAIAKHLQRPAPPEPVHRDYFDVQSGEATPSNQTLELERAAKDISEVRAAEKLELQSQSNADLHEALNYLQQEQQILAAAAAPQPESPQQPQEQPDYTPQLDPEAVQAMDPQYDPELIQALSSPKVRAVLEQVNAGVEQTKAQYAQATAQLAQEAAATMAALVPEIQGMTPDQARGALALMAKQDPQRVAALQRLAQQSQNILAAAQQQQQQAQAQQYQRAEATFRQFAAEQDARVLTNDPPETVAAIRNGLLAEAKAAGISEKELITVYNTNSAMRHSFVQNLIADGMRFRLAQRSVSRAASRPIPNVQRPGSPALMQTRTEAALAEAQAKLKPSMSPKEAAQYLIARRGANR